MLTGFRKRLDEAKNNGRKIKVLFQYPASHRAIKKSGNVIEVAEDSFTINEKFDGECTYSYNFLVEVSYDNDEDNFGTQIKGGRSYGQQEYGQ